MLGVVSRRKLPLIVWETCSMRSGAMHLLMALRMSLSGVGEEVAAVTGTRISRLWRLNSGLKRGQGPFLSSWSSGMAVRPWPGLPLLPRRRIYFSLCPWGALREGRGERLGRE